jgi:hypothetical protein
MTAADLESQWLSTLLPWGNLLLAVIVWLVAQVIRRAGR